MIFFYLLSDLVRQRGFKAIVSGRLIELQHIGSPFEQFARAYYFEKNKVPVC